MTAHPPDFQGLTQIPPLDIRRLLAVLWYGKLILLVSVGLAVWGGGYYAFHINQPRFAATVTLRVDPQATDLRDVSEHWATPATDKASLNTELTILTSHEVLSRVVESEALLHDPEFNRYLVVQSPFSLRALRDWLRTMVTGQAADTPNDRAILDKTVQNLRDALQATNPRDTYLFRLRVTSRDAAKAARLANAIAASYVASQVINKDTAAKADIAWLDSRVAELREQLQRQENRITALRATAQLQDANALAALSNAVLESDQQTAALSAELADLATLTQPDARQLAEQSQLQDQLIMAAAQGSRLSRQLAEQSAGLAELEQMQRDADATRILYEAFLSRLQETQVQQGLDVPDARILAPATIGQFAGPRRVVILQVSALLGGIIGVFLIAARHLRRKRIVCETMLSDITGQPVGGIIPTIARGTYSTGALRNLQTEILLTNELRTQVIMVGTIGKPSETGNIAEALARCYKEVGENVLLLSDHAADQADVYTLRPLPEIRLNIANDEISDWRQDFDRIIVDTGLILKNKPKLTLGRNADVVLFCARWSIATKHEAAAAFRMLQRITKAPIVTALTDVHPRKLRRFARMYPPMPVPT